MCVMIVGVMVGSLMWLVSVVVCVGVGCVCVWAGPQHPHWVCLACIALCVLLVFLSVDLVSKGLHHKQPLDALRQQAPGGTPKCLTFRRTRHLGPCNGGGDCARAACADLKGARFVPRAGRAARARVAYPTRAGLLQALDEVWSITASGQRARAGRRGCLHGAQGRPGILGQSTWCWRPWRGGSLLRGGPAARIQAQHLDLVFNSHDLLNSTRAPAMRGPQASASRIPPPRSIPPSRSAGPSTPRQRERERERETRL